MWLEECQRQICSIYNSKNKVKIIPWDQSNVVHIDDIYTQLSWFADDRKPSGVTKERLQDYTDIFSSRKNYPKPKRILVYGRPGIGKTVFTQKTTYDWSQKKKEMLAAFDLVLQVKLRDVCDLQDIPAILRASELLASDGKVSVEDLYKFVVENQEKVLLILDGYDEYSAGEQSPVRDIWERKQLRDCCVILTTRQIKLDVLRNCSDAQFEINGFDSKEQVKEFALKFLKDENDFEKFYRYVLQKDLEEVVQIPLLLLMLCLVWTRKDSTGLPTSRADIYTQFIQTLLNHMSGKVADVDHADQMFRKVDDYAEEFCQLGKLAFAALLRDSLHLSSSEVPGNLMNKLIEVGLFQVSNLSSLNPDKGVFFIHKSVQEFLAAWYLKHELKDENSTSLSKIDSAEKIFNMSEVLEFASELSGEAAWEIASHMGVVAKKEGLAEYNFEERVGESKLTYEKRRFHSLIEDVFFCCSPEMRQDRFPAFLSHVGGVLLINSAQLRTIANEHMLKSTEVRNYILIVTNELSYSKYDYCDLITVLEDVNAVVVSCSGEEKAADFLKKYPFHALHEFFVKKEENAHLYIRSITNFYSTGLAAMLKELIASPESSQQKTPDAADQSDEQNNGAAFCLTENTARITLPTCHCLSTVEGINVYLEESEPLMGILTEVLPLCSRPNSITIEGKTGVAYDAQLVETLVSHINFTDKLEWLQLINLNLTAKCAAIVAKSLHQAPYLNHLDLSENPLGEGVSVLIQHLSSVPHPDMLCLTTVKMTKEQVHDLTTAARQSKVKVFRSSYHVSFLILICCNLFLCSFMYCVNNTALFSELFFIFLFDLNIRFAFEWKAWQQQNLVALQNLIHFKLILFSRKCVSEK